MFWFHLFGDLTDIKILSEILQPLAFAKLIPTPTMKREFEYNFTYFRLARFFAILGQNMTKPICCRRQITKFHHNLILRERDLAVSPQIFLTKILPFYDHDPP